MTYKDRRNPQKSRAWPTSEKKRTHLSLNRTQKKQKKHKKEMYIYEWRICGRRLEGQAFYVFYWVLQCVLQCCCGVYCSIVAVCVAVWLQSVLLRANAFYVLQRVLQWVLQCCCSVCCSAVAVCIYCKSHKNAQESDLKICYTKALWVAAANLGVLGLAWFEFFLKTLWFQTKVLWIC